MFTPQQRQEYLEWFGRSGLTQAQFCREAKLHAMTFSRWRRRAAAAVPAFAEVRVSTPRESPLGTAAILHLAGDVKLQVSLGCEAAWRGLGVLLKSLQA